MLKNPSMELSWLPNSFIKGLPEVDIGWSSGGNYGGMYQWSVQKKKARIVINIDEDDAESNMANTIAHEMRHHYQYNKYGDWTPPKWTHVSYYGYKEAIVKYFKSCPYERDALKFSNKVAPVEYALEWEDWCGL